MDNSLSSEESRLEMDVADELVDRSLRGLDAILEGCLESIASGGKTDQMIDDSLTYLHQLTGGSEYNDQYQEQGVSNDDVVLNEDAVSNEDVLSEPIWVSVPNQRLTYDCKSRTDDKRDCETQGE